MKTLTKQSEISKLNQKLCTRINPLKRFNPSLGLNGP